MFKKMIEEQRWWYGVATEDVKETYNKIAYFIVIVVAYPFTWFIAILTTIGDFLLLKKES